jgi:hypothetical protein
MWHLTFPVAGTILYTNLPKKSLELIPNNFLRAITFVHNLSLHIFSLYIFSQLFREFIIQGPVVRTHHFFEQPHIHNLLFYFYLSKYYEYVDTMILYAKKKNPIFLQKFHHIGAVFTWHLGYVYKLDGLFYASLINSGVHTIMYLYYCFSLFPQLNQYIRKFKVYITSTQVAQLIYGGITLPLYYYSIETETNKNVIIIFDVYIACLIFLFLQFMFKNYV